MLPLTDPVVEGLFGLGSGVISGIAGLFGADAQSRNVRNTNEMNYKIAQETNANSMAIARENNQAQLDAMRENNAFNKQSAIDMFNLEAEYNSPSAQVERLLKAGINPATLYGQGGSVGGSVNASTPSASGSGISPSNPSLVTPTMQVPPSVLNGMFGNIESITRSIGNVVKSGLDLTTKKRVSTLLGYEVDKMIQDIEDTKIQNASNAFKLSLDKLNLPKRQAQEIAEIVSKIFKNYADGGASHALIAVHEAEKKLKDTNVKSIQDQLPYIIENLKKLGVVYDEQAKTEKSKQGLNSALAGEANARAENIREDTSFLKDVHEARVNLRKNESSLSDYEVYKTKRTVEQQVEYVLNQTWASDIQKQILEEQLTAAKKSNSWYDWNQVLNTCETVVNTTTNAVVPWKSTTTVKSGYRDDDGSYYERSTSR